MYGGAAQSAEALGGGMVWDGAAALREDPRRRWQGECMVVPPGAYTVGQWHGECTVPCRRVRGLRNQEECAALI